MGHNTKLIIQELKIAFTNTAQDRSSKTEGSPACGPSASGADGAGSGSDAAAMHVVISAVAAAAAADTGASDDSAGAGASTDASSADGVDRQASLSRGSNEQSPADHDQEKQLIRGREGGGHER